MEATVITVFVLAVIAWAYYQLRRERMKLIFSPDDNSWYWQRYSDWKTSQLFKTEEEARQARDIGILKWV